MHRKAFTLLELLIVIAILAVLATVAVLVINPLEYIKQSRDAKRTGDIETLSKAVSLFQVSNVISGATSTLYISLPDNASSTCGTLGLPSLPSGWTYGCVNQSNLKNINGTGWLPIDLTQVTGGAPMSSLPIDPVNTTSSGNYYAYSTDGTLFEFTALAESKKYKNTLIANNTLGVMIRGTSGALSPLFNSTGLIGFWNFDEGSGLTANDKSGANNTGDLINGPTWIGGRMNNGIRFVGGGRVDVNGLTASLPGAFSVALWSDRGVSAWQFFMTKEIWNNTAGWLFGSTAAGTWGLQRPGLGITTNNNIWADGNWHHVVAVYDGVNGYIYADGVLQASGAITIAPSAVNVTMGIRHSNDGLSYVDGGFEGVLDDVRIYNRAISGAEAQAIYNATK